MGRRQERLGVRHETKEEIKGSKRARVWSRKRERGREREDVGRRRFWGRRRSV